MKRQSETPWYLLYSDESELPALPRQCQQQQWYIPDYWQDILCHTGMAIFAMNCTCRAMRLYIERHRIYEKIPDFRSLYTDSNAPLPGMLSWDFLPLLSPLQLDWNGDWAMPSCILTQLTRLTHLYFSSVDACSWCEGVRSSDIASLTTLVSLSLYQGSAEDVPCLIMPDTFTPLTRLVSLSLSVDEHYVPESVLLGGEADCWYWLNSLSQLTELDVVELPYVRFDNISRLTNLTSLTIRSEAYDPLLKAWPRLCNLWVRGDDDQMSFERS